MDIKDQRPKIERISDISHRANLLGGYSVEIPMAEQTIWEMELPQSKHEEYQAIDYRTMVKPKNINDIRIDFEARLTEGQLFALHNRIALVTGWFPTESNERPWKDIFSKFHSMVLYTGTVPVGIAHFTKPAPTDKTVELKYIGLREDMIGKGMGGYFTKSVLAYLAQHYQRQQIVLGTTSFDNFNNKSALEFHKHMGFVLKEEPPVTKLVLDARRYYAIPEVTKRHHDNYLKAFS